MDSANPQRCPAIRLVTLGGLAVVHASGAGALPDPPRRRLALLAVIAAAGAAGASRDKLLLYFWPESDEERARHALTQTLYALRRDVGGAELLVGSAQIRLASDVVTSDIGELEDALARGEYERAVSLYAGPFLDGVHLPGLIDFERWVDGERARIAGRVERALERLAADSDRVHDHAAAVRWWRRLAELDPLSARHATGLMRALATSGNLPAAIRHAGIYEALVRQDLDLAPDPEVRALATSLSESPAATAVAAIAEPVRTAAVRLDAGGEGAPVSEGTSMITLPEYAGATGVQPVATAVTDDTIGPAARPSRRRTLSAGRWAPLAGLAAAGAIAIVAVRAPRTISRTPALGAVNDRGAAVLVTDVENATGDSVFDRSLTLALASELQQSGQVSVFPRSRVREVLAFMGRSGADTLLDESLAREIAQRAGLRLVIVPAIARMNETYVVIVRVTDAATGTTLATEQATADGRPRVLAALDVVSRALRRRFSGSPDALLREQVPLPAATTGSLEALQLYADGQRASSAGKHGVARELYEQAIARDSNFALARAALGGTLYWLNMRPQGDTQFDRALSLAGRLSGRERLRIQATAAGWRGDRDGQIRLLSGYVLRYPRDLEMQSALAYAHLRAGQLGEARTLYERLLAVDSSDANKLVNLATTYAAMDSAGLAIPVYRRAFAVNSGLEVDPVVNNEYGAALVRLGRLDEARAAFGKLLGSPQLRGRALRSLAYLDLLTAQHGLAASRLAEAIQIDQALQLPLSEVRDRLLRAAVLAESGRPAESRAEHDSLARIARRSYLEPTALAWVGQAAARSGNVTRAREILGLLRERARAENTSDRAADALLSAEIELASGRPAAAMQRLELASRLDSSNVMLESLAYAAEGAGDLSRASELQSVLARSKDFGWEGERPKLLAPYRLGRIEEARGNRTAAVRAYEWFVARWAHGDSTVIPLADARRRLAALR